MTGPGKLLVRTRARPFAVALLALLALPAAGCAPVSDFRPTEAARLAGAADVPPPAAAPDSLRIVTYNIQYGEHLDQALADLRADPDLREPDILLLQEMTGEGAADLAAGLGLNFVYYPASIHPHHGRPFGNAVLSRWPITASRMLVLPHPQPVTGNRRIAVCADLDVAGIPVRAVSVHTATMILDQQKRLDQVREVADSLAGFPGPIVIGGDFNTATAHEANLVGRIMRNAGLRAVRLPPGGTIRGWKGGILARVTVLDHLFVRGLAAGSAGIARQAGASDHYPVWAVAGRE